MKHISALLFDNKELCRYFARYKFIWHAKRAVTNAARVRE